MPNWFAWMFVGGIVFMLFSFIASKVQNKVHKKGSFVQDFLSGSIVIAFLGLISPDLFPELNIPLPSGVELPSIIGGGDDFDVQVGPLRR